MPLRWVIALSKYAVVSRATRPKMEKLSAAKGKSKDLDAQLAVKKAELSHVEASLALLQQQLHTTQQHSNKLLAQQERLLIGGCYKSRVACSLYRVQLVTCSL